MIRRIIKYTVHQFHLRHRRGRGIHSPYLFEFVHEVLFNAGGVRVPEEIRRIHRELGRDRTVRSFIRGSSVSMRYGALLFRIARWFHPDMVLELGTGLGVSTLYLASGAPDVPLHTLEGQTGRAAYAASLVCRCGLEQVSIHWGEMDQKLEDVLPQIPGRFLTFIDANHRYEPTIKYVRMILSRAGEEALIVMDDLYWSPEMERAWKEIISWPEVRASLDLFRFGILLLRKDLQKMHFKINY